MSAYSGVNEGANEKGKLFMYTRRGKWADTGDHVHVNRFLQHI